MKQLLSSCSDEELVEWVHKGGRPVDLPYGLLRRYKNWGRRQWLLSEEGKKYLQRDIDRYKSTKTSQEARIKRLARSNSYGQKVKKRAIDLLGGKCQCCGIIEIEFLTVDHINGGGHQHRQNDKNGGGRGLYAVIVATGVLSKKSFRILCMNCNLSLGLYGYCPHRVSH